MWVTTRWRGELGNRLTRGWRRVIHRKSARRLNDNPPSHFNGVVSKALVEQAHQRHVDGGRDTELPLAVHQHREQMPVQIVHRVVFFADPGGLVRVAGQHNLLGVVT